MGGLLYLPAARVPYVSHTSGQPRWEASQHGTQDVSNLTDAGGNLVLSFGVNDFESRLGNKSTWRKCGACWHRCRAQRRRALHAWRSEAGVVWSQMLLLLKLLLF